MTTSFIEIRVGEVFELPLVDADQDWRFQLPNTNIVVVDDTTVTVPGLDRDDVATKMRSIKIRALEEGVYHVGLMRFDDKSPNIILENKDVDLRAGRLIAAKYLHFPGVDDSDDDNDDTRYDNPNYLFDMPPPMSNDGGMKPYKLSDLCKGYFISCFSCFVQR
jgi:hypothetical protein